MNYKKSKSILELRQSSDQLPKVLDVLRAAEEKNNFSSATSRILSALREGIQDESFELSPMVMREMSLLEHDEVERYLNYRHRYERYPSAHQLDKYPPLMQIEPASSCNFRCVFCYQTDNSFTRKSNGFMGHMDYGLFVKLIDELHGNVEAITLASRGEPLLNKSLPDMLAYMKDKFIASKLNTNASLLDEKMCHDIFSSGLKTLVLSVDAADPDLYSELRVNGKFEIVRSNIEMLSRIREVHYPNSKTIIRISGVKFSTVQSLDEIELFWGQYVDQVAFVDYNPWENVYDSPMTFINEPCSDLWRRMFIWWNGNVGVCDVDYKETLLSQSFPNQSICEIWQGEKYAALRKSHASGARGVVDPCNRCAVV